MKRSVWVLACVALAACEQTEQTLPFGSGDSKTTRQITDQGGVISSGQGASVEFPAGSLGAATGVTLTAKSQPAQMASGTPVGTASFQLAPEGTVLAKPAAVTLKLASAGADAWLAGLVNSTPAGTQEIGAADVDLSAGLVRSEIGALGTLTVVVPERDAVVRAESFAALASGAAGTAAGALPTRKLEGRCGAAGDRCRIRVGVSESLRRSVEDAAVVYPRMSGAITLSGGRASGRIELTGALKSRVGQVGDAEAVRVVLEAVPATVVTELPGEVVLQGVRVTGEGAGMAGAVTATVRVRHDGASAARVEVTRDDVRVNNQSHTVRVTLPLIRS